MTKTGENEGLNLIWMLIGQFDIQAVIPYCKHGKRHGICSANFAS